MAGLINAISAKINADTAGVTGRGQEPPTVAPPGILEMVGSDLASIVSGGHSLIDVSDHSLVQATESVDGKLGGLRPAAHTPQAPGPNGPANVAKGLSGWWGRIAKPTAPVTAPGEGQ